jgi:hypothetical protein
VKVWEPPAQIAALGGVTVQLGVGLTVTVTEEPALVQPLLSVTVTVYTVVVDDEANGLATVVLLRPVAGDQL